MDIEQMYQEQIMDHYKNPRNRGKIDNATHHKHEKNPLCGDVLDVYFIIEKGIVKDVKIDANGCAISTASASMLSENIKGKKVEEVKLLKKEDILEMLGIPISAARLKCALLSMVAFRNALETHNKN